jgi:pimeloyl-ACP methyl ester carboxylesterase
VASRSKELPEWRDLSSHRVQEVKFMGLHGTVLIGHSIAGQELSSIGARRSNQIAALVYLDAAADNLTGIAEEPRLREIMRRLPTPEPGPADRASFAALQAWYARVFGITYPVAEFRNRYETTHNGTVGKERQADWAWSPILKSLQKPDYRRIEIPVLAIYSAPRPQQMPPWLRTADPDKRAALDEANALAVAARERAIKAFRQARESRVVVLESADHYVFPSNEADVLREVRT